MRHLTRCEFEGWLESYGRASRENNPRASADLFALDAAYYESPFDPPIAGREAIYRYWEKGARNLKDKAASFEILALKDNLGIARWQSEFTVIESGKRIALDCLFVATFDDAGKCCVFREWWHHRVINSEPDHLSV